MQRMYIRYDTSLYELLNPFLVPIISQERICWQLRR